MSMSGMSGMAGMASSTAASASTTAMSMASSTGMSMASSTGMNMASSTAAASMSMDMGGGCKISMLWNWNTVDACFISSQWRISSDGIFALSCIGVILLVMSLEFLRRLARIYDAHVYSSGANSTAIIPASLFRRGRKTSTGGLSDSSRSSIAKNGATVSASGAAGDSAAPCARPTVRPTPAQQIVRATIHMLQFAVAYFIMLLAMYYNGYIIICIFIGAFLGFGVFAWEGQVARDIQDAHRESTMCCG